MEGKAEKVAMCSKEQAEESEKKDDEVDCRRMHIPLYRWVMHGAVMFGREFCYAMETSLVTPVLLQIGLPEQYYSLTWLLSPILGFIFTPLIGSASDCCTLRWGRRRPFILALCVGVLMGVSLFLNGSLIGLSIGDSPGSQTIGIILTVIGVVVLDFSADASEGPIRAYLLDVADTEEQDMALNIHTFSAGLGGAVGYMLSGLDWTHTALGHVCNSQQQVLFLFAGIFLIVSVTLHMLSIPEKPLIPSHQSKPTGSGDSPSHLSPSPPVFDVMAEEDAMARASFREDNELGREEGEIGFLAVDGIRCKSDSVLAMPDPAIELDPDLHPDDWVFLPESNHILLETQTDDKLSDPNIGSSFFPPSPPGDSTGVCDGMHDLRPKKFAFSDLKDTTTSPSSHHLTTGSGSNKNQVQQTTANNGVNTGPSDSANIVKTPRLGNRHSSTTVAKQPLRHTFYRQPSFTFSYYGRVGSQLYRFRRAPWANSPPITTSRSLNDLSDLQKPVARSELQLSFSSLSSDSSSSEGQAPDQGTTVRLLWLSMMKMPKQLWRLCICHLITWFSIMAQSIFYTDFMGQVIYHGDPKAQTNSTEFQNYNRGVKMGCWGLVVYAATAAVCSAILQKYLDNFDLSIKAIYIVGTVGFSVGTAVMAIFPNVYVAMTMISSMGIFSMSVCYCPYALLGQYHEIREYVYHSPANTRRGFGIDCAILTCQVYISQILVASALGSVIEAVGSVRVIPMVASGGSFLGFLTACYLVIYPDVESGST